MQYRFMPGGLHPPYIRMGRCRTKPCCRGEAWLGRHGSGAWSGGGRGTMCDLRVQGIDERTQTIERGKFRIFKGLKLAMRSRPAANEPNFLVSSWCREGRRRGNHKEERR